MIKRKGFRTLSNYLTTIRLRSLKSQIIHKKKVILTVRWSLGHPDKFCGCKTRDLTKLV